MNLLLLLSVLLSVLGGAGDAARPVAPATLASPVSRASAIAAHSIVPARRPQAVIPARAEMATAPLATAFGPLAAEPRYAARRRE